MRRSGNELDVEAMSLEGVVDRMVTELHLRSDDALLTATESWQDYMQWLAHGVRSLARDHPKVFPLIATRHPAAPWLRPPLRSLRVVEDFLSTFISRGFDDARAVEAYRAFSSFLLGHLLLEATLLGAQTGPAKESLDEGESARTAPCRTASKRAVSCPGRGVRPATRGTRASCRRPEGSPREPGPVQAARPDRATCRTRQR